MRIVAPLGSFIFCRSIYFALILLYLILDGSITTDRVLDVLFEKENESENAGHNEEQVTLGQNASETNDVRFYLDEQPTSNNSNNSKESESSQISAKNKYEKSKNKGLIKDPSGLGFSELSAECDDLQAKVTCKICLDSKIQVLFLPCRHLVCCENCANEVRECPLCRASIEGIVKVFL